MWSMFKKIGTVELQREIDGLEIEKTRLDLEVTRLTKLTKELALEKKISEEDIKHMVRLKEERMEVKAEKDTLEMQRKADERVMVIKLEYQGKVEDGLTKQLNEFHAMYDAVLNRLPDINVELKGKVG